ncbi:MAG: phosphoenolpyruvate carboxykinase (ATP) [Abditibacteriota bacterium]|nr:phosphoenolpyruvate carboxykinase (ATP) [Abditibacteriota bacterium]MBP5092614.1 phosphoenolpyruvate carboxykinase (ATP) [Abditibacteriota bacterium]MBP5737973.1 phosphoenolpyruvate carboxykinase (ATP) [Abditibacteriota bacterium]
MFETVSNLLKELPDYPNVIRMSEEEIARAAAEVGIPTRYGSRAYAGGVKNRTSALTVAIGSKGQIAQSTRKKRDLRKSAEDILASVAEYMKKVPILRVDAAMGANDTFAPRCVMYLSLYRRDSVRLAHMVLSNLFPARKSGDTMTVIAIPEWQEKERSILVFPDSGVTFILGSDYYGEIMTAFRRTAIHRAAESGVLGLHAGAKTAFARDENGKLRKLGMLFFGIAGTGKTTHVCHNHGLTDFGEGVKILQDELVFMNDAGSVMGSERGFYIKTCDLTKENNPLLYYGAIQRGAVLENVLVDGEGNVCFEDKTLTNNGRAIVRKEDLGAFAADSVNLPPLDELDELIMFFMVRRTTVMPIVSRLTPEQAAVAFLLSESVDITGADAKEIQKAHHGPMLLGGTGKDANIFCDILRKHSDKISCYMLNTGGVGEIVEHGLDGTKTVRRKAARIPIDETSAVIRSIARGDAEWREDPDRLLETPSRVGGMDISRYDLSRYYEQDMRDALIADMRREQAIYVGKIKGLSEKIKKAAEF